LKLGPYIGKKRFWWGLVGSSLVNLRLFGLSLKSVCGPGLNCHGCPLAGVSCPIGVMTFSASVRTFPALAVGTVLTIGALAGRLVCGFLCPFGVLQELLYRIPTRKFGLPNWTRYIKYAALLLLVLALPLLLGYETSTEARLYYCKVCPKGTLTATLPYWFSGSAGGLFTGGGLAARLAVLVVFLALMVTVSRAFCRTFCPLGAIYGLVSRFAMTRVVIDNEICTDCGACDKVCPVELDVRREVGSAECIACGECIKVCPVTAISRKLGP